MPPARLAAPYPLCPASMPRPIRWEIWSGASTRPLAAPGGRRVPSPRRAGPGSRRSPAHRCPSIWRAWSLGGPITNSRQPTASAANVTEHCDSPRRSGGAFGMDQADIRRRERDATGRTARPLSVAIATCPLAATGFPLAVPTVSGRSSSRPTTASRRLVLPAAGCLGARSGTRFRARALRADRRFRRGSRWRRQVRDARSTCGCTYICLVVCSS